MRFIFPLFLFVCLGFGYDFSYCLKHYQTRALKFKNEYATPVIYQNETYYVFYSKKPILDKNIIKADPFIGLYLIDGKKKIKGYELRNVDTFAKTHDMALIGFEGFIPTKVLSDQSGFLKYGSLTAQPSSNNIVGNICYQVYGITTAEGFIAKRYIDRFLSQDKPYYADIGIRLKNDTTVVEMIDPFFEENPFLPGDEIVSINNIAITSANVEWEIANLLENAQARIQVLRKMDGESQKLEFLVRARRAYGGLLLQDSFFESQGIKLDKDLVIRRVHRPQVEHLDELKRGDQILQVEKIDVAGLPGNVFENLRQIMSNAFVKKGYIELLISRSGFNFYLKIYPKNHYSDERLQAIQAEESKKDSGQFELLK